MADPNDTPAPAVEAVASQVDTPEPQAPDDAPAQAAKETFDAEYVSKLREEAAKHRKEKQELAARLKEYDDAKLSEQERLTQAAKEAAERADRLDRELRQERTASAIRDTAAELGLKPALAVRLLATHAWEYGDDGKPQGVKEAMRALVSDFPELAGGAASAANPARNGAFVFDPKNPPRVTDPSLWR